ncbi:MAG: hypothetical protein L6Q83_01170 [Gammaproteobacteria bacterium]|nr:hypothetical protein [Gammaproteobacteria bacterium]
MMRAPGLAAIHAAELRVAQSGCEARDQLRRAAAAFRANLARPTTLALAAAAAGLLGFWLARRSKPQTGSSSAGTNVVSTASVASLVGAVIMRYGMQYLPFLVQQVRAAWGGRSR